MKVRNIEVYGLTESAIASGYPMAVDVSDLNMRKIRHLNMYYLNTLDGENAYSENHTTLTRSMERAKKLGNTPVGTGHSNFLKGIIVQADLTCSQSIHMQILRYHFLDIVSSQSKLHRLLKMKPEEHCNKYVSPNVLCELNYLIDEYHKNPTQENYLKVIYSCPMGLELTFRFTTNYLQLKTIYNQRHNHKLPEWQQFCNSFILNLPHFKELTGCGKEVEDIEI